MRPKLSILVPGVPSRLATFSATVAYLCQRAEPYPVEVLYLLDNRRRTIGEKRQALLDVANGVYVAYVDDDDWVTEEYLGAVLDAMATGPDVITFPTLCARPDQPDMTVYHALDYPNEDPAYPSFRRKPWHVHPIRTDLARMGRFPPLQYGEDYGWLRQVWPHLEREVAASTEPLYVYRDNPAVSEAR